MAFLGLLLLYLPLILAAPAVFERAPSAKNKVIIQMFEWTWDSIASECTDFIGPAGYGYVQGIAGLIREKIIDWHRYSEPSS